MIPAARRSALVLSALLLCVGAPLSRPAMAAEGETRIEISYTFVADRLDPEPSTGVETQRNITLTLSGGGHVDESLQGASGKYRDSRSGSMQLGQTGGGPAFRVLNPHKLQRIVPYAQGLEVDTVSVGDRACQVEVSFLLQQGAKTFAMHRIKDGSLAHWTKPRVTTSQCTIR